jgi:hypothetical protein
MTRRTPEYYARRETFKAFAAFCAIPLMFFGAAVFDPGALGEIARATIELIAR